MKKTNLWSLIYIKLTWSNGHDNRKTYFCLKCHIWWEINQTNFLFGFSHSLGNRCHAKCVIGFLLFSCDQDGRSLLTSTGLSVDVCGGLHKVLYTASNCFGCNHFCNTVCIDFNKNKQISLPFFLAAAVRNYNHK